MPSLVFSNQVANPNSTLPVSLNLSLTSKGVDIWTLGSNAYSILFNSLTPLLGTTTVCTVTAGGIKTEFRVDDAYDASQFALQLKDGTSSLFTINISTPNSLTLTSNGFDSVSPEKLRKWGQENGGF